MSKLLMPKATAVWLVENTSLTFDQIADFCNLHPLEVKGIADGEVATGIIGIDPIVGGQLTRDEIERCEKNSNTKLLLSRKAELIDEIKRKNSKRARYTPVARRQDKPDAISWLLKHCPSIKDAQIIKLIGTTKNTIKSIRERSHWNIGQIKPRDPVLLGLCTQTELDLAVDEARKSEIISGKKETGTE
ncbi:MAG: DUF1013 domain-containing protein [Alphaproteobacteria bacterium]|nr:DUF1013 domain-containing protein [Alphaproteobacteria bacterium]